MRRIDLGGSCSSLNVFPKVVQISVDPGRSRFLLQAHPTAQFNGGDDYQMGLWSWWLLWYPTIVFSTMGVMILDATILLSATFIRSMRIIFYIVAASLLGSGIGLFVLAHASPSA